MQVNLDLDTHASALSPTFLGEGLGDAESTFLTFDLDGQTFAVAVLRVREILDTQPLTRLPNSPHDVLGVIDVRGESVPVVDLTSRLGIGSAIHGPDTRMIVFEFEHRGKGACPVGVLADRVRDVCRIDPGDIEAAPDIGVGGIDRDLILGLCRRDGALIVVIDLVQAFSD